MKLDDEQKWFALKSKLQRVQITKLFRALRMNEIEPVLIKGIAISRFYPKDTHRKSVDIDIAVSPEDFEKSQQLLGTEEFLGMNVDLHEGLRHLDTRSWSILFGNSITIKNEGELIRVLAEEDHLRVLCVHWLNDGGENKPKLWDIYYGITNRSDSFKWEKCFSGLGENRKYWIIYTIGLAHKYLDLDITNFPFRQEATNLPPWLTNSVESIWNRELPYQPLDTCYTDRKMFLYQLKLRFPPNPIMSTIGVEGHLNSNKIFYYQIKYLFMRAYPSAMRYFKSLISSNR